MINFITLGATNCYNKVIKRYIDNIVMGQYQVSNKSYDNMVNVHFFLEKKVLEVVKLRGINVFICHGIADKRYRVLPQLKLFDYIVVSGPTWRALLIKRGVPVNKIIIGGYVKIDHLFGLEKTKKHILWAPSHNVYVAKANLSSYPDLLPIVERHPNIIQSTHPANNKANTYTDEAIVKASVVIADAGSTIYEAWALDIPVVFPDWIVKKGILHHFHSTLEADIYNNNIGYHVAAAKDFNKVLQIAVNNGITKQEKDFIEGILPKSLRGTSGETTWGILKQMEAYL